MISKRFASPEAASTWRQGLALFPLLAISGTLLTGCPHNDYTVELKPSANGLERALTFYRVDGADSNGVPNYLEFSTNELAAIARIYPPGAVKPDGKRFVAKGEFAGPMPKDVGGAGSYVNLATSLGGMEFYLERFRGADNLAARTAKQYAAADQITDLVIGWAKLEFGGERGWKQFRRFLDVDFRDDLKNAGQYFEQNAAVALYATNASGEFAARFCQYLLERGYIKRSEAPELTSIFVGENAHSTLLRLVRQCVASKMNISDGEPAPKSFAVLASVAALEKSWTNYLARTDLYRAQIKDWEKKTKTDPKLERPKPEDAINGLIAGLLGASGIDGETDHLTVKLALDRAPDRSNGKWRDGQVIWEADLDPNRALPVLCFASWSRPDEKFQISHFGKVLLDGDELAQYCSWQHGLDRKTVAAWEAFLARVQPGEELKAELQAFSFYGQPDNGRRLLVKALEK